MVRRSTVHVRKVGTRAVFRRCAFSAAGQMRYGVERAGAIDARRLLTRPDRLAADATHAGFGSPAVILMGSTVGESVERARVERDDWHQDWRNESCDEAIVTQEARTVRARSRRPCRLKTARTLQPLSALRALTRRWAISRQSVCPLAQTS